MRHPCRTVPLVAVAVVLLTGCSRSFPYQLLLTVRDADTGASAEGVSVILDASILAEERKANMEEGYHAVGATDKEGQFAQEVRVNSYPQETNCWYLKLRKDGFEPLTVTIKPPEPRSGEVVPLPVTVELKPLPKKP